jgi:hypothetical protein
MKITQKKENPKNRYNGTRGKNSAFFGRANEHFTHQLLLIYSASVLELTKNGEKKEKAHKKAIKKICSKKWRQSEYNHVLELKKIVEHFDEKELFHIFEDAKKTTIAILEYITNHHKKIIIEIKHVGMNKISGNADLLLCIGNKKTKSEYIGVSLKYTNSAKTNIKIYSPTVNKLATIIEQHYKEIFGKGSGLHQQLLKISKKGIEDQQKILANHSKARNNNFKKYNTVYKNMSEKNLKMKIKLANILYNISAKILDCPTPTKRSKNIKKSFFYNIANLHHKNKLPTFLVYTDRRKSEAMIYDVEYFFACDLSANGPNRHKYTKKSAFEIGPMTFSLDCRPTSTKNPLTSFPVNITIKNSDIIKFTEQ